MDIKSTILITGAGGLLGHGLKKALAKRQDCDYKVLSPSSSELNLLDESAVLDFFEKNRPDYIFHLAAMVFGLKGNLDNQLLSLSTNVLINRNVMIACARFGVKKVFFAGTVAEYGYPYKSLPLQEEHLLKGPPHWGEYGYAMAKREALSYLEILQKLYDIPYTYGLLTNLYGPHDRFNTENGHVIPSLLIKAMDASKNKSQLRVWGRPETTRDFMFSEDAGEAILHAFEKIEGIVNIASGVETSMQVLVETIQSNFSGISGIEWQQDQPVGIPRRSIDISKLRNSGFATRYSLEDGIRATAAWLEHTQDIRK